MKALFTALLACLVLGLAAASNAQDWGNFAFISSTMGNNANKLCLGEGLRASDIGCPTYAPTVLPGGYVGIGNNTPTVALSVNGEVQVSNSGVSCSSGTKGAIRYSNTSNTLEYCNSTTWVSAGPSATVVPAFSVNKAGTNQTVVASTPTKLTWSSELFDTNNNFASDRFTPTIPGLYLVTLSINCSALTNTQACQGNIRKNAVTIAGQTNRSPGFDTGAIVTVLVQMNGTTDYMEAFALTEQTVINGNAAFTKFEGALISMAGGGSGGSATPAGATADIQFNSSGALAADTGLFTYAAGLLKAPTISTTQVQASTVSLSTAGINWGYLASSTSYIPNLSSNLVSSSYVSTSIIQVSGSAIACSTTTKGSIRYSNTSNTLEYCNSTAWVSAGPSGTVVPAFSVNKGGSNQTVTSAVTTNLTWSTEAFDTNNNFSGNAFTPTIPGKYLLTLNVHCSNSTDYCIAIFYKNGALFSDVRRRDASGDQVTTNTALVDANGTTDTFTAQVYMTGTTVGGNASYTNFSGILISMAGGGSSGSATPAGSTADIQFNSAGALGADTGNFTYASGLLTAPRIAATQISATNVSVTGLIQVSGSAVSCSAGTKGSIRYSNTSNTLEYCNSTAWVSAGPSDTQVPAFSVHKNGSNQTVASNVVTKVTWATERFDTNNNFASDRFTPTVPGKYLISAAVYCTDATAFCSTYIYKNGVAYSNNFVRTSGATGGFSDIVDMNGTSDYIEIFVTNSGGTTLSGASSSTFFSGILISMSGSGSGGGTATPAGSTADVQFNSAGALAADTGNFTYSSGLLKAPSISTTTISATYASLTTIFNPGSYSGNTIAANSVSSTLVSATNISSSLIQVGNTGAACANNISGSIRYSIASDTLQVCTGLGWKSLVSGTTGVSALASLTDTTITSVADGDLLRYNTATSKWVNVSPSSASPAFKVHRNGTVLAPTNGTDTLIPWTTEEYDTNNNFNIGTGRFTPTVPGKYLIAAHVTCITTWTICNASIYKNGVVYAVNTLDIGADNATSNATAIIDMNGSTDYVSAYVKDSDSGTAQVSGVINQTYFEGVLLSNPTSGGGGTATPAGSTGDVQFNTAGALAADTGNFTYASGLLKAPTISATTISATYASLTTIFNPGSYSGNTIAANSVSSSLVSATNVSASLVQVGTGGGAACDAARKGSIRYSNTSNTLEYCNSTAWVSAGPSSTQPVAFKAHRNGVALTGLVGGTDNLVSFTTLAFDTNNNFNTGTSRYTPTVPGKYLFTGNIFCNATANSWCLVRVAKNGVIASTNGANVTGTDQLVNTSTILDMNGATDYVTLVALRGATGDLAGAAEYTNFMGVLLAPQGNGLGGATPAGSTKDIQFNTSGALDADTGKLTYDKATGTVSLTNISASSIQLSSPTGAMGCAAGTLGTFRMNATSGVPQICLSR